MLLAAVSGQADAQTRPASPANARPAAAPAPAQQAGTPASSASAPVDGLTVLKLVWTTMAAIDHANVTGNYSVLRDLGSPSFQANNTAASLAGVFQTLRNQRVDLSNTLLVSPTYDIGPVIVEAGLLRVRGIFPLRPNPIAFDLLYQPYGGKWMLFGVAVAPVSPSLPTPAPGPRR